MMNCTRKNARPITGVKTISTIVFRVFSRICRNTPVFTVNRHLCFCRFWGQEPYHSCRFFKGGIRSFKNAFIVNYAYHSALFERTEMVKCLQRSCSSCQGKGLRESSAGREPSTDGISYRGGCSSLPFKKMYGVLGRVAVIENHFQPWYPTPKKSGKCRTTSLCHDTYQEIDQFMALYAVHISFSYWSELERRVWARPKFTELRLESPTII